MPAVDVQGLDKLPVPEPVKFESLGQDVWFANAAAATATGPNDPDEILLFAWMNAKMSHILKYASEYRKMYPAATMLVIETHSSFFFSSYATQKRILQPVIQRIQSNPSAKRLVHALSNGGACQFAALAEFLHQEKVNDGSPAISPTSIIFDSCPGCTDLGPALKAFTMGMPAVARYPTYMLLTGLWLSLFCYDKLIATEPGHILKMRRDLNNLEYISKDCPRLYIYSDTDELVPFGWVEEHAAEAKQKGATVSTEAYKNSAHVSHARSDGERYWSAVQKHWQACIAH